VKENAEKVAACHVEDLFSQSSLQRQIDYCLLHIALGILLRKTETQKVKNVNSGEKNIDKVRKILR
jgi:uncharacterized protein YfeS